MKSRSGILVLLILILAWGSGAITGCSAELGSAFGQAAGAVIGAALGDAETGGQVGETLGRAAGAANEQQQRIAFEQSLLAKLPPDWVHPGARLYFDDGLQQYVYAWPRDQYWLYWSGVAWIEGRD